jgi:DNA-binding transcriptional ArsR family regulator
MHAFDVLGDPVRRRILQLLADGERTSGAVSDVIREEFGISQPAVSQHLRVLRDSGFASVRPEGARRLYAVRHEPLRDVDAWLDPFRRFWAPHLDALGTELARGRRADRLREERPRRGERHMIDVSEQISAVRREVGTRVLEAGEARTVTISQVYPSAIEDVWEACTNPERIPRWFLPVSGELRLGGHYALTGNASGTITSCDPPRAFDATWEYGGGVSWIELRLSPEPGGPATRFALTHIARVDDRWEQFGPGAVGVGWDLGIAGLAKHLASGDAIDLAAGAAWAASDDGRHFITLSSSAWGAANVAAGAEEDEARAAADRTTAAYTGAD